MNEIKELIKKAKKEEKTNPEFLYQLGLRFKNGDGVKADIFKADKYFEKASKLGHLEASVESALFWWKTVKNYYFTEKFLSKAIALGSEEAKELLAQMKEEEAEKKGKHAKVFLNWAQAVVKVQFIEQVPVEELAMEEANEGEKE